MFGGLFGTVGALISTFLTAGRQIALTLTAESKQVCANQLTVANRAAEVTVNVSPGNLGLFWWRSVTSSRFAIDVPSYFLVNLLCQRTATAALSIHVSGEKERTKAPTFRARVSIYAVVFQRLPGMLFYLGAATKPASA